MIRLELLGPRRRVPSWLTFVPSLFVLACFFGSVSPGAGQAVVPEPPVVVPGSDSREDRRGPPLLDAPVDRVAYALGPGDRLELSLIGELNRSHALVVTPEGFLVVPAMGVVDVRGRSLQEAEVEVRRLVSRYHRNLSVFLTLAEVRRFRVFVVGDVISGGAQEATAMTRVSEVVEVESDEPIPRRNVIVRRLSGDSIFADLRRFRQTGDLLSNPLLREGDVVIVPGIDRTVAIFGRVRYPGVYEYREGETLAELLAIANGGVGFPSNAGDTLRISRFTAPGERVIRTMPRVAAVAADGASFPLRPFDAVYVPGISNYMEQKTAKVQGQVMRPGEYPIRPDTTTVGDLVAMAGGLTPYASLAQATLRRDPEGDRNAALQRLLAIPDELRTPEERRLVQISLAGDLSQVVADFEAIFAGGEHALDQPIREGDVIEIPQRRNEVLVLGAVLRPGIVAHNGGASAHDFVRLAGGYARRADRGSVVVLRAGSGARVGLREARVIEPGDAIIVPYRERVSALQIVQTTGFVVSTVSSMILAYIAIFHR